MINELNQSTEWLYQVFSRYPPKSKMDGCSCCVSETDKFSLHAKPLRELEDEDISKYAFKAMTTWGDIEDFKHFLPRILELLATRELMVDTFVVLGKLEYGNWQEWEKDEIEAINAFLNAWWKYDINNNSYFDNELLIEINKRVENITDMLSVWILDIPSQGFKNFAQLLDEHYYDLVNSYFKGLNKDDTAALLDWIESNTEKLTQAFFFYESVDKAFSSRLSDTLYTIERFKKLPQH